MSSIDMKYLLLDFSILYFLIVFIQHVCYVSDMSDICLAEM